MSENKVISKLEIRFQVYSKAKHFLLDKVPEKLINGLLRRKRLSKGQAREEQTESYGKTLLEELTKEAGCESDLTEAPTSKPQSKALKPTADFSENVGSTSTYEESNATGALELQSENECAFPFLIDICNKENTQNSRNSRNAKNGLSKHNFKALKDLSELTTVSEEKRNKEKTETSMKKAKKNFLNKKLNLKSVKKTEAENIYSNSKTKESLIAFSTTAVNDPNIINDRNATKDLERLSIPNDSADLWKNCEVGSKSESMHNFDIYLPEEGESLEIDFAAGDKRSFGFADFSKKNSQENLFEATEANPLLKDNYESEVFCCNNNLINNKNDNGESSFSLATQPEADKGKGEEGKEVFGDAKRGKARKKRENGVDELMQDSFLRCFFNTESKGENKQTKKTQKNSTFNNNYNNDYSDSNEKNEADNKTGIKSNINQEKVVSTIENFKAESQISELSQCILDAKKNEEEENIRDFFSGSTATGFSGLNAENKEFDFAKKFERKDYCADSSIKKIACLNKKNYKKKVSAAAALLIKEHYSHRFMFKHFPREYRKETFNIRYQKQQNRRRLLKDKIFISASEIKLEKFYCVNLENKTNLDHCLAKQKGTSDLELNEECNPKKIWDPSVLEENLIGDYLFNIERNWPLNIYHFSQDAALDFLMLMKFNIAKTVKYIQFTNRVFKSFMKDRDLKVKKSQRAKEDLESLI